MKIKHNDKHPLAPRIEEIMEGYRVDQIGYPSDWMILGDLVIIATLGGGAWNEPELIVQPVKEFVKEREDWLR